MQRHLSQIFFPFTLNQHHNCRILSKENAFLFVGYGRSSRFPRLTRPARGGGSNVGLQEKNFVNRVDNVDATLTQDLCTSSFSTFFHCADENRAEKMRPS